MILPGTTPLEDCNRNGLVSTGKSEIESIGKKTRLAGIPPSSGRREDVGGTWFPRASQVIPLSWKTSRTRPPVLVRAGGRRNGEESFRWFSFQSNRSNRSLTVYRSPCLIFAAPHLGSRFRFAPSPPLWCYSSVILRSNHGATCPRIPATDTDFSSYSRVFLVESPIRKKDSHGNLPKFARAHAMCDRLSPITAGLQGASVPTYGMTDGARSRTAEHSDHRRAWCPCRRANAMPWKVAPGVTRLAAHPRNAEVPGRLRRYAHQPRIADVCR